MQNKFYFTFGTWKQYPYTRGQYLVVIASDEHDAAMAIIYATLIIKGKKTFADVPDRIKDKVKEVLVDLDCPELAE